VKLNYLIIYVDDVGRAVKFYENAFGLSLNFMHESKLYAEMDTGNTTLSFAHIDMLRMNTGLEASKEPQNRFEIAFSTDDVKKAFDQALTAGAREIKQPETKEWGQTVAYVRDPYGIMVEICTPVT
jgi:lactoylglutathione lyase